MPRVQRRRNVLYELETLRIRWLGQLTIRIAFDRESASGLASRPAGLVKADYFASCYIPAADFLAV
jgi:hypothetical protein